MRTALFKVPSDGYGEETVNSQENKPRLDSDTIGKQGARGGLVGHLYSTSPFLPSSNPD